MRTIFDNLVLNHPLQTLADDKMNDESKHIWEHESLGGIAENNAPLPRPVAALLILTFSTAVAITFPLYGQRPNAAIYSDYVALMGSPEVQKVLEDKTISVDRANEQAMALITKSLKQFDSPYEFQRAQHPITMNELRLIAPKIVELQQKGVNLQEYSIIGAEVVKANFEGNILPNGERERIQPWWDKGYHIAFWWFIIFCLAVIATVKRLPPITWKPDHTIAH